LDRSLGRIQVPTLLRDAGLQLRTLAEVYGVPADEDVSDVEWLTRAGDEGCPVLMKDERIRYRSAERDTVLSSGVQAFCLVNGNLRAAAMAELFIGAVENMAIACQTPGPFIYTVSTAGLRRVDL
jgi:PIN like domain